MNLYVKTFKNSKILNVTRYPVDTPSHMPIGSVLTIDFVLDGNRFVALNGGPFFKLSEAVSLMISCKDQGEIDYFYEKLSAAPEAEICGWMKDRFGLTWQVNPMELEQMLKGKNAAAVMTALLKMRRIDLEGLRKAASGD